MATGSTRLTARLSIYAGCMSESALVREWHADDGWGVLDSPATPGGCWAHFSVLDGALELHAGQQVELDHEVADQDGFSYRATRVRVEGEDRATVTHESSEGFSSSLRLDFD